MKHPATPVTPVPARLRLQTTAEKLLKLLQTSNISKLEGGSGENVDKIFLSDQSIDLDELITMVPVPSIFFRLVDFIMKVTDIGRVHQ